jgi:hypothetical protein
LETTGEEAAFIYRFARIENRKFRILGKLLKRGDSANRKKEAEINEARLHEEVGLAGVESMRKARVAVSRMRCSSPRHGGLLPN